MIQEIRRFLSLMLLGSLCQIAVAADYDWAMDNLFNPSFSSMLNGAAQFAQAYADHSAATACWADPQCGMPDDPGSGFELPAGDCCEGSSACIESFDGYLARIDSALYTLYKNERTYEVIMQIQKARMTAMKGAGSMSAPGGAVVARMEVDIAKAQKGFIEKFNAKTQGNIGKLNEYLLALGEAVDQYCTGANWYQRNGMPIYLHAKTKFPK
jgi:hypothetical protein